ncbi:MAG: Mu transposase C-terminal domain-containing protein [Proteobacteria bacterium]|nr:Mu transposase C-terminal domain-containing protein [Pseudomonadota bacterium]MCL2306707.1 Mu transposase C-terminal domain-containing protein [Pseudomonadota bacterium]
MRGEHYSARDLAEMKLPGLPSTERNILRRATVEGWAWIKREGSGGGRLYAVSSLPVAAQEEIKRRAARNVLAVAPVTALAVRTPESVAAYEASATGRQRLIADARRGVIAAVEAVMQRTGYCRQRAATALLDMAKLGELPEQVMRQLELAKDTRGRGSAAALPSVRSLLRFMEQAERGSLVPVVPQRDMSVPAWAPVFMSYYQRPEKPSVQHAFERFAVEWSTEPQRMLPSIHQVRRFLEKVGHVSREVGRMGPREIKSIKPCRRRRFEHLLPCDIYSADGHTFDAEVQHPYHGRPFRPEITSVIDIATRRLVGWSVSLSESRLAVLDSFRHAVELNGIPALFYVDNGSGYVNEMMQDVATGFMSRLAVEMVHSVPYNSQARGVIERLHKTLWVKAAKELPGYMGADMDRQARQLTHKISRQALKQREAGVSAKMPLLGWQAFINHCEAAVQRYNDRPHRTLPKININGTTRHMTPNEVWAQKVSAGFEPHMLSEAEKAIIWRPHELRTVQRGEVVLWNNRYFSKELEEWHGSQLRVAYDLHDASRVWVYDDEERFVCTAELNGNQTDYYPMSVVEQARDKRAAGREKRLRLHLDEVQAERRGKPAIEQVDTLVIPGLTTIKLAEMQPNHFVEGNEMVATPLPASGHPLPQWERVESTNPRPPSASTPFEKGADDHFADAGKVIEAEEWCVPKTAKARHTEWKRLSVLPADDLPSDWARSWIQKYPQSPEYKGFLMVEKMSARC